MEEEVIDWDLFFFFSEYDAASDKYWINVPLDTMYNETTFQTTREGKLI